MVRGLVLSLGAQGHARAAGGLGHAGFHGPALPARAWAQAVVARGGVDEIVPRSVAIAGGFPVAGECQAAGAGQQIVEQANARRRRAGICLQLQIVAARGPPVDQGVVHQDQLVLGPGLALGAVGQQRGVFGLRALHDQIAHHPGAAAVGELQLVAGAAIGFVAEAVVEQLGEGGAAFQQVAEVAVVQMAADHAQLGDAADVEVVVVALARQDGAELAVFELQARVGLVVGQHAHLVAVEAAVAQMQRAAIHADAGAIAVGHAGAAEVKAFDALPLAGRDEDAFAHDVGALGLELHPAAHGAQMQAVLRPVRHIGPVLAGVHLDQATIAGGLRGGGQAAQGAARADLQHLPGCAQAPNPLQASTPASQWRRVSR